MNTSELIERTNIQIDDRLPSDWVLGWLNAGLDDLGTSVEATFPHLSLDKPTTSPVIPEKWHDLLVIYASARAKQYDSSIAEADFFWRLYDRRKEEFEAQYVVPNTYDDRSSVTVVTGEVLSGVIDGENKTFFTNNKFVKKDSLTVYDDGAEVDVASVDWNYGIVVLKEAPATGSALTADYQYMSSNDSFSNSTSNMEYPPNPFSWWGGF